MKWPRGKYNGRKITGGKISLDINLLRFEVNPWLSFGHGFCYFIWLIFRIRFEIEYEF